MPTKESKWTIVAVNDLISIDGTLPANAVSPTVNKIMQDYQIDPSDQLSTDNGDKSEEQQQALNHKVDELKEFEQKSGPQTDETLMGFAMRSDESLSETDARAVVDKYRAEGDPEPQAVAPEAPPEEAPVATGLTTGDSFGMGDPPMRPISAKTKKPKKQKKHLKGKGPVNEKANEIYEAIIRDKTKGEPSKDEQASAAAIAWSQAKKTMKKKAYFRGEEAKILDSYRGMWGEELVHISVNGRNIDVPRESIEFVSAEHFGPVDELAEFLSHISDTAPTYADIKADLQNLRTAKDMAYRLMAFSHEDLSETEEETIDAIHTACEKRITDLQHRLASFATDEDLEYVESLPKYEIGERVFASSFSTESAGWMDEVIEDMATEAEQIDVNKLAHEDPLIFVASLSEEVIANASAVKSMAMDRVSSAAGPLDEETKDWVVSTYIEKVETARRKALANMKQDAQQNVENQQRTASSVPDEGLFL